jgi:hypothetical protein
VLPCRHAAAAIKTCSTDNPCVGTATCLGNDQVGFTCACPVNTQGNGFPTPTGTGCTACTPPAWSPGGGSACDTIRLHSQYLGNMEVSSQARSLRGVAANGQFTYVGFISVSAVLWRKLSRSVWSVTGSGAWMYMCDSSAVVCSRVRHHVRMSHVVPAFVPCAHRVDTTAAARRRGAVHTCSNRRQQSDMVAFAIAPALPGHHKVFAAFALTVHSKVGTSCCAVAVLYCTA